jgi:hypothetical protein
MPEVFPKPKCYVFIAHAPAALSIREAARVFNRFLENRQNGLVLYHDHFVGVSGAFAVFYLESLSEFENLSEHPELAKWAVEIHPLIFTEKPVEMLYQMDFTMGVYRGKRLRELVRQYEGSDYEKSLDKQKDEERRES